jgi:hypothetical protein
MGKAKNIITMFEDGRESDIKSIFKVFKKVGDGTKIKGKSVVVAIPDSKVGEILIKNTDLGKTGGNVRLDDLSDEQLTMIRKDILGK